MCSHWNDIYYTRTLSKMQVLFLFLYKIFQPHIPFFKYAMRTHEQYAAAAAAIAPPA